MKMGERLTNVFMNLFCEKNSDGMKNLRLTGNELNYRIGKRLEDSDMEILANFLNENPLIVKLDLAYNNITDNGLMILVEEFLSFPNNLTQLCLVCNNITHIGVKALCSATATLELKSLRLTGNKIGFHGALALQKLLKRCVSLEHLDIGDTDQTIASVPIFCSSLLRGNGADTSLKTIDISNIIPMSNMYQASPTQLAAHLGEMIKINTVLIELHIQKCQLDGHDIALIINGLKLNKTLLLLDIGFNRIGNYGAEIISEYLKLAPKLIGLNISGNGIGDNGAKALCIGIPFSRLRMLDFSKNQMSDIGVSAILTTLRKSGQMLSLFLWGNTIGPKSIEIMRRHFQSRMYKQKNVDFKVYVADGHLQIAFYPSNLYKHRYYSQLNPHQVRELRIRRNKIPSQFCNERAKINFNYYERIEGIGRCNVDLEYNPSETNWKKNWSKQLRKLSDNPIEDQYKDRFSIIQSRLNYCYKNSLRLYKSSKDVNKRYKLYMKHFSDDIHLMRSTRALSSRISSRLRSHSV